MKRLGVTETVCDMCGRVETITNGEWVNFLGVKDLCPACADNLKRKLNGEDSKTETDPTKMTNKELANALREDAEWAHANEWETPITLADDLEEAADRIENGGLKWIACKDRMPEAEALVLFVSAGTTPQTGRRMGANWYESWTGRKVYGEPTHWMEINGLYADEAE